MNLSKLSGTPWHPERMHRDEDDRRRYKGRCRYFQYEGNECIKRNGRCIESAHCSEYEALTEAEFKKKQADRARAKTKKFSSDDDVYWY